MAKVLVLIGISGSPVGQSVPVHGRTCLLGSAANSDIVLHDRQVLARHAEIRQMLTGWFVVPLSANASVAVNGTTVVGQARLQAGDLLSIGTVTFKAVLQEAMQVREVGGR